MFKRLCLNYIIDEMKFEKNIFTVLIFIFVLTGCKKTPVACFSVDKTSAAINTPIVCDGRCSQHAKIFNWLGTGIKIPGNELNSVDTIYYNIPGIYTIKLEVINSGKTDITSKNVTIY